MAQSYLRRNDVGYPQQPNPVGAYFIKLFEGDDLTVLQDDVNQWLLELPKDTQAWSPHLVETEMFFYEKASGPQPREKFVIKLTLFLTGRITAVPSI